MYLRRLKNGLLLQSVSLKVFVWGYGDLFLDWCGELHLLIELSLAKCSFQTTLFYRTARGRSKHSCIFSTVSSRPVCFKHSCIFPTVSSRPVCSKNLKNIINIVFSYTIIFFSSWPLILTLIVLSDLWIDMLLVLYCKQP